MNKLLIGLIVLVLGIMAGWYIFQTKKPLNENPINLNLPNSRKNISPTLAGEYRYTEEQITASPDQNSTEEKGGVKINDQTDTTNISVNTINYEANGFNPPTLTIKLNTTVKFVNNTTGMMWVASAPHPTHSDLPEFDQKKSVGKGGIYEYTFTKVGTWKYHNHAAPDKTGIVVVVK